MKKYSDLNTQLKNTFGCKIFKLSLDGGFSCPNRQQSTGCIFCSEKGSGEFSGERDIEIEEQIEQQISFLSKKWKHGKYIAYFGTYTSTYADVEYLKKVYDKALACSNIVGLAISTRPDCVNNEVLELLASYNEKTFLWVELGLQTIHDPIHKILNTGYSYSIFLDTFNNLKKIDIKVVPHLILGLPGETVSMMLQSIKQISLLSPWGIKIHMLYILHHTKLYKMYQESPFHIFERDEYAFLVIQALELLDSSIVIHRLTGDPPRKDLFIPKWAIDKRRVLQLIEKEMILSNTYQGKYFRDKI